MAAVFIVSPISAISFFRVAEFADGDRATVKAGAEVGDKTELALINGGRFRTKPVESGKTGADACRLVHARSEPPGRDDFVTHVFVNLAAGFGDGERNIDDEAVEQVEKPEFAEALGNGGRGAHIDEKQRPLLEARMVIAPRGEGEERARTEKIVDAEQEVADDDANQIARRGSRCCRLP